MKINKRKKCTTDHHHNIYLENYGKGEVELVKRLMNFMWNLFGFWGEILHCNIHDFEGIQYSNCIVQRFK